jgi:hypothetical protein
VEALGYPAVGQADARRDNDYLCNDVAFVALHASANKPSSFAAGLVTLPSPALPRTPAVGFLHFPAVDSKHPDLAKYGAGVAAWARVLARTVKLAAAR